VAAARILLTAFVEACDQIVHPWANGYARYRHIHVAVPEAFSLSLFHSSFCFWRILSLFLISSRLVQAKLLILFGLKFHRGHTVYGVPMQTEYIASSTFCLPDLNDFTSSPIAINFSFSSTTLQYLRVFAPPKHRSQDHDDYD